MNAQAVPIEVDPASIEGPRRSSELVRDEDVLSLELQHALEQVGSAVGILVAIALVFSQLPRARRLAAGVKKGGGL